LPLCVGSMLVDPILKLSSPTETCSSRAVANIFSLQR
jgi:hypothetical protein